MESCSLRSQGSSSSPAVHATSLPVSSRPSPIGKLPRVEKNDLSQSNGAHLAALGLKMTPEVYSSQFPGALPLESKVYGWHIARNIWYSATIIHARYRLSLEDYEGPLPPVAQSSHSVHLQTPTGSNEHDGSFIQISTGDHHKKRRMTDSEIWTVQQRNYDYYIHFHGEDRRHDTWVVTSLLRPCSFIFPSSQSFIDAIPGPDDIHKHMDADYLREHEENTKVKTIGNISIGEYLVGAWYFSPYPKEYQNLATLYICQFCLSFFKHESELLLHSALCTLTHPPGNEIYRDTERGLAMFEVDGSVAKIYCENLCFLSKLFLDHKTLRHPVFLFLFYVLTESFEGGHRLVGYFSKEKYSKNNLSCIMCLPQHQRKGYGQFLISISYALSRREGRRGTPERPLSDLGHATYIKYWSQVALSVLLNSNKETMTLEDIATATSIEVVDLALALESVGILRFSQPGNVPYLFLPQEFDNDVRQFARPVFSNRSISLQSGTEITELLQCNELRSLNTSFSDMQSLERKTNLEKDHIFNSISQKELTDNYIQLDKLYPFMKKEAPFQNDELKQQSVVQTGQSEPVRVPERRSKRRRSSTTVSLPNQVNELVQPLLLPKRSRTMVKTALHQNDVSSHNQENKHQEIPQRVPIESNVNLAWLRWEPYDLHMGPYEYAPTAG